MSIKSRQGLTSITGSGRWVTTDYTYNKSIVQERQTTHSVNTGWPIIKKYLNGEDKNGEFLRQFKGWEQLAALQDWGSAFMTERCSISSNLNSISATGNYSGAFTMNSSGPVLLAGFGSALAHTSDSVLEDEAHVMFGLGGTAISAVRPNKPMVDLATSIGELRTGGIPSVIGSSVKRAKTVLDAFRRGGDEYLNIQFGWKPLVNDLIGLAQVAAESRKRLERYESEIGRLLHRRYQLPGTVSTVEGLSKETAGLPSYAFIPGAPYSVPYISLRQTEFRPVETTQIVTKSYFSGAFRFYYPDYPAALEHLTEIENQANLLLGTRLDPEVLWNLQPWTWLIDWYLNVGDILGNISAFTADHVVMQYGYLMRETRVIKEITFPRGIWARRSLSAWNNLPYGPLTVTQVTHRKRRAKASPFGFGLNPSDFSPDQWAILGALGISRGIR